MEYGVVIPARNEAEIIGITLRSIWMQTIEPDIIVVVDDSSTDDTGRVAEIEGAVVVRLKRKSRASATGTPYLAYVINKGLELLEKRKIDFVMISGAESIYPRNYVERILEKMVSDKVVVASGIALGEKTSGTLSVRGSGRIINAEWFRRIGFRYPHNYGFETWILLKALSMGLKVAVYSIGFYQLRRTSFNPRKAYFYGKAMRALGYPGLYATAKILKTYMNRRPREAYLMMKGYLTRTRAYRDIEATTRYILIKELTSHKAILRLNYL